MPYGQYGGRGPPGPAQPLTDLCGAQRGLCTPPHLAAVLNCRRSRVRSCREEDPPTTLLPCVRLGRSPSRRRVSFSSSTCRQGGATGSNVRSMRPFRWRFIVEKFGLTRAFRRMHMPLVAGRIGHALTGQSTAAEGALAANLAVWLMVNVSRSAAYRHPRGRVGWSLDSVPPWFSSCSLP